MASVEAALSSDADEEEVSAPEQLLLKALMAAAWASAEVVWTQLRAKKLEQDNSGATSYTKLVRWGRKRLGTAYGYDQDQYDKDQVSWNACRRACWAAAMAAAEVTALAQAPTLTLACGHSDGACRNGSLPVTVLP